MNGIIWLASYPKSGNTWLRVFLTNYLGPNSGGAVSINQLQIPNFSDRKWWDSALGWKSADLSPRLVWECRFSVQRYIAGFGFSFLKTHNAYLDPRTSDPVFDDIATYRVIYIIRNPLDIVCSLANHTGLPYDEIIRQLNNPNQIYCQPMAKVGLQIQQPLGSWSWHVCSWRAAKLKVLIVRYEDMLLNPEEEFGKICDFANLVLDKGRLRSALEHSAFSELQAQEATVGFRERLPACPKFFNKGKSGTWREYLTPEQVKLVALVHRDTMKEFGYLDQL